MTILFLADILLPRERRRRERVAVGKRPESCRAVRGSCGTAVNTSPSSRLNQSK
mgnify:CR=1 FL=1